MFCSHCCICDWRYFPNCRIPRASFAHLNGYVNGTVLYPWLFQGVWMLFEQIALQKRLGFASNIKTVHLLRDLVVAYGFCVAIARTRISERYPFGMMRQLAIENSHDGSAQFSVDASVGLAALPGDRLQRKILIDPLLGMRYPFNPPLSRFNRLQNELPTHAHIRKRHKKGRRLFAVLSVNRKD